MTVPAWLALVGLAASFVGSLILAVSLNSLLSTFAFAIDAHDVTIEMLTDPRADVPVFKGIEVHVKRSERSARVRTILGIAAVGLGAMLQGFAVLLAVR